MKNVMPQPQEREGIRRPSVVIDPNPRRESEMLDRDGNVIDPKTKQIIKKASE